MCSVGMYFPIVTTHMHIPMYVWENIGTYMGKIHIHKLNVGLIYSNYFESAKGKQAEN